MTSHKNVEGSLAAPPCKRVQRGFGIISAVFLLVVLAGLGAAMANLSIMQRTAVSADVLGAHAYQAARAGIEWGLYQSLIPAPADVLSCPSTTSFTLSGPILSDFTVTVRCDHATLAANPQNIVVRQLTSVACNQPVSGNCTKNQGGTADYIERAVDATFEMSP